MVGGGVEARTGVFSRLSSLSIHTSTQKEITIQIDLYLVSLSSKTYVFEDKLIKY